MTLVAEAVGALAFEDDKQLILLMGVERATRLAWGHYAIAGAKLLRADDVADAAARSEADPCTVRVARDRRP